MEYHNVFTWFYNIDILDVDFIKDGDSFCFRTKEDSYLYTIKKTDALRTLKEHKNHEFHHYLSVLLSDNKELSDLAFKNYKNWRNFKIPEDLTKKHENELLKWFAAISNISSHYKDFSDWIHDCGFVFTSDWFLFRSKDFEYKINKNIALKSLQQIEKTHPEEYVYLSNLFNNRPERAIEFITKWRDFKPEPKKITIIYPEAEDFIAKIRKEAQEQALKISEDDVYYICEGVDDNTKFKLEKIKIIQDSKVDHYLKAFFGLGEKTTKEEKNDMIIDTEYFTVNSFVYAIQEIEKLNIDMCFENPNNHYYCSFVQDNKKYRISLHRSASFSEQQLLKPYYKEKHTESEIKLETKTESENKMENIVIKDTGLIHWFCDFKYKTKNVKFTKTQDSYILEYTKDKINYSKTISRKDAQESLQNLQKHKEQHYLSALLNDIECLSNLAFKEINNWEDFEYPENIYTNIVDWFNIIEKDFDQVKNFSFCRTDDSYTFTKNGIKYILDKKCAHKGLEISKQQEEGAEKNYKTQFAFFLRELLENNEALSYISCWQKYKKVQKIENTEIQKSYDTVDSFVQAIHQAQMQDYNLSFSKYNEKYICSFIDRDNNTNILSLPFSTECLNASSFLHLEAFYNALKSPRASACCLLQQGFKVHFIHILYG